MIALFTTLLLSGCGSDNSDEPKKADGPKKVEVSKGADTTKDTQSEKNVTDHEAYPLPTLEGWEEIEVSFKTMGDGKIELWSGEFSYEGSSDDYFKTYQMALKDEGYEVEVKDDSEGFQSLHFTITVDGKNYVGDALFTQNWVKSSLQHFK